MVSFFFFQPDVQKVSTSASDRDQHKQLASKTGDDFCSIGVCLSVDKETPIHRLTVNGLWRAQALEQLQTRHDHKLYHAALAFTRPSLRVM